MIDHNSQFMAILTAVGEAKQANADALGIPWTFTQMGVGDANGVDPIPARSQTQLINEQRRAPLNQVRVDPKNTSVIIAEQVIPENVGGWWIREIGLYDADDDLVAVANCAPSFKPLLAQGSGKTQVVRMNFIVTSAANVTLKIDPSVVLATRQYVDGQIIEVLPPTRLAGKYRQVLINERGVVIEGYNPDTLLEHGITDAYTQTQTRELLSAKADLAESLAGYGIPIASREDAEAGTDNALPMTALRVLEAIAKKLGNGFVISLAENGYIKMPVWMGGLIMQWGKSASIPQDNSLIVTLPMTYPTAQLQAFVSSSDHATSSTGPLLSVYTLTVSTLTLSNDGYRSINGGRWFSIGY